MKRAMRGFLCALLCTVGITQARSPLQRMHEKEKQVFVTIGHRGDLSRLQFALDEGDPYVLLGSMQVKFLANAQASVKKDVARKYCQAIQEMEHGRRLFKFKMLNAMRSELLVALMEQEGCQTERDQLIAMFDTLVDAQVDISSELFGAERKSIYICDGEQNEAVTTDEKRAPIIVAGGWLTPSVISTILQPVDTILVDGDLIADAIRTNCISPAVPRFPTGSPQAIQLQSALLPPQTNLGVNALEVSKIHFVGEIPAGNFLAGGANQKGIRVLFDSIPVGGVYIRIGLNAKAGTDAAFYIADAYVNRDGTTSLFNPENHGPASITPSLISNLPGSVSLRLSSDIALTNGTISYKVIAKNINCVVLAKA